MKKKLSRAISLIVALISCLFLLCSCGDRHGDGKTSCKNCGRSQVYALGFCKSCYNSFIDYTYG